MTMLLASGCSITHGTDLVHPFYHVDNLVDAYPAVIAREQGLQVYNLAMPGASNQYIFHSLVERITQADHDISVVIAGWTFNDRLCWQQVFQDGSAPRHWFFTPRWACSVQDFASSGSYQRDFGSVYATSDSEPLLQDLRDMHQHITRYYFHDDLYRGHLNDAVVHYSHVLEILCTSKKIKFIQIDCAKNYRLKQLCRIENLGLDYLSRGQHPNKQEHRAIADYIQTNLWT